MEILNFQHLFERGLEFAYDNEQQLIGKLPKMIEHATSPQLQNALQDHLEQTRAHHSRLETIFKSLDRAPADESHHSMRGILSEGDNLMKHIEPSALLDSGLLMILAQVEHNEIALYGSLILLARQSQYERISPLLEQSLAEEKAADQKLAEIAAGGINRQAINIHNPPHHVGII